MASLKHLAQARCPIAFGGASVSGEGGGYGFGDITEDDAISLIRYCHDRGIEVFDTAPIYGFGMSERRIGKALKDRRDRSFIISKSGVTWHDNKRVNMTNDPVVTKKMLEQSLRDLDTDYIDLYFIHWPDQNIDIRRPMEVLAKARMDGKINSIGLCNTSVEDLEKAREVDKISVVQSEYNFFSRQNSQLFDYLRQYKIEFMSYGTFDKGVLTGRVTDKRVQRKEFDSSDCRSWAPWWKSQDRSSRYKAVVKLKDYLNLKGHRLVEFALAYNLQVPEITTLLCGMRTQQQVDEVLESLDNLPDKKILEECEQFYVD